MTVSDIQKKCKTRREQGAIVYGEDAHLERNMFEELREELYDVINYAVFQIDKINKLEEKWRCLNALTGDEIDEEDEPIDPLQTSL
jgi:hypothetical protein